MMNTHDKPASLSPAPADQAKEVQQPPQQPPQQAPERHESPWWRVGATIAGAVVRALLDHALRDHH